MIRLIAIDLDGTLLDPSGAITERNRAVVRRALAAGTQAVVVTARTFEEALPFARDLGLGLPLLCCHGALVKDTGTGEVYTHLPVPASCTRALVEAAQARDWLLVLNQDGRFVAARRAAEKHGFAQRRGWDLVEDLHAVDSSPTAIRIIDPEGIREADEAFRDRFGGQVQFIQDKTRTRWILSIVHRDATKMTALRDLAARLGIDPGDVLAIGDGPGDVPMIRWAGLGVVMANAIAPVQAEADWVTLSNADDGVAVAIERFVLSGAVKS